MDTRMTNLPEGLQTIAKLKYRCGRHVTRSHRWPLRATAVVATSRVGRRHLAFFCA